MYSKYDRMPGPGEIVTVLGSTGSVQAAQSAQALSNTLLGNQLASPLMQQAAQQSQYLGLEPARFNEMMRMDLLRHQIDMQKRLTELEKIRARAPFKKSLEDFIYDIVPTGTPFQEKLVKRKPTIRDELQAETNKWLEGALH